MSKRKLIDEHGAWTHPWGVGGAMYTIRVVSAETRALDPQPFGNLVSAGDRDLAHDR